MQIKSPKTGRPGYVQLVRNKYDASIGRGRSTMIGSMSIFQPCPPDLWALLDPAERVQLAAYQAQKMAELNLVDLEKFAAELPGRLGELSELWPTIADDLGQERAHQLADQISKAMRVAAKAMKATQSKAIESTGSATTANELN